MFWSIMHIHMVQYNKGVCCKHQGVRNKHQFFSMQNISEHYKNEIKYFRTL